MLEKTHKFRTFWVILTIVLWLTSVVIAFALIAPILDSITRIYAAFWADPDPIGKAYFLGVSIRHVSVFVLAFLFMIGIIGGAEHHSRNFNTQSSWHVMFLTYAILLTLFIFTIIY